MGAVIDKAVSWAIQIAKDDSHGYDQAGRNGPDYDCSSLVINAYKQAGAKVGSASYTGDMYKVFTANGFKDVTGQINLSTGSGLKKGDVLLNVSEHASLVIEDGGKRVNASRNENGQYTGGKTGDQTGNEISIKAYSNYYIGGWDYVLRYNEPGSGTKAYTSFPKYKLSEGAINYIAGLVTREQGGTDILASRQEASQIANLSEVTKKHNTDENGIMKTVKSSWYGYPYRDIPQPTQIAIDAVKFVLCEGKRVLPRYVTEHDMFPLDAAIEGHWYNDKNEDRSQYKQHQTKVNQNPNRFKSPGTYTFYCFFGSKGDCDIAGYYPKDYEKYKNDIPWTEGADNEEYLYSENSYTSEDKEPTVVWNNRRKENINTRLQDLAPIEANGELAIYVNGHNITKYLGGLAWDNSIRELSTKLSFETPKTDAAYLKDLIYVPGCGDIIRMVTNTEVFRGIIISVDDGNKTVNKYSAVDLGWYLNKTSQTYQFKNITAKNAITEICEDLSIPIAMLPELDTLINQIYFDRKISEIITDVLEKCPGDYNYDFVPEGLRIYKTGDLKAYPKFKIADNIPQFYSPEYMGNVSHSLSAENMKNSVKITSEKDNVYSELMVLQNREAIDNFGFLQEVISIDPEKENANIIAKETLEEQSRLEEKFSFEIPEKYDSYTRAGEVIQIEGEEYLINSTSHSIKNGQHYNKLDVVRRVLPEIKTETAAEYKAPPVSVSDSGSDNNTSVASNGRIIVIDPGHGKSSDNMSSSEKTASGYEQRNGVWGEWTRFKAGTWGEENKSGGFYSMGDGDRDTEPDLNLQNALAAKKYLEEMGYSVRMTRTTNNENPSFTQRAKKAFANGDTTKAPDAVCIVCLHSNAGGGKGSAYISAGGSYNQKYIPSGYASKSNDIGKKINDRIVAQTSLSRYGSGEMDFMPNLILFHKSPVPVAYMEIGFFDNSNDLNILKTQSDKIGRAIAEGVNDYLGG